jgi:hypothetical protein
MDPSTTDLLAAGKADPDDASTTDNRDVVPLFDEFDDHAPGTLTWLQAWYASHRGDDWKNGVGISIDTLDNPGWTLRVDLHGTDVADKPFGTRHWRPGRRS